MLFVKVNVTNDINLLLLLTKKFIYFQFSQKKLCRFHDITSDIDIHTLDDNFYIHNQMYFHTFDHMLDLDYLPSYYPMLSQEDLKCQIFT